MKSKLLILSLVLGGTYLSKAQVVDISGTGVDFHVSTAIDTFYSEFNVFAGLQVSGHDKGHVMINAPEASNPALSMVASGVTLNTDITDVILELTDDMTLNLEEDSNGVGIPEIKGGLKLGYSTEIHNTGTGYVPFASGAQQYRYVEQFDNGRSTIIAPSLKVAERDSLRFGNGSADNSLSTIHLWDNKTVSYVTGHGSDAEKTAWTGNSADGVGSTGTEDFTVYDPGDGSYTHHEVHKGNTYVSESFGRQMVDNGRAVVVYYGNVNGASVAPTTKDSIFSYQGFHDGTINLDITNNHPSNGLFRHWHMIGNPYKESIEVSKYLALPLEGANAAEVNGYFTGRTISVYTDIDANASGFQGGYAVVNSAGAIVGVNNDVDLTPTGTIPTLENIAAGQGFFVFHTAVPGETVKTTFNNDMRTSTDGTLRKMTPMSEPFAYVNVKQVGDFDKGVGAKKWNQLAFTISEDIDAKTYNATAVKQDLSVGADKLMSTRDINIYTQNKHEDKYGYALQALKPTIVNKLIPVGFETKQGNVNYEFSLSNLSVNMEDYDVFIIDRLNNTTHNISKNGSYTCNVFQPGQQQDRFFLKFGHAEEEGFVESVEIYSNGNFVNVSSNSPNTEIEEFKMYDVLGKEIVNLTPKTFQTYEFDIRNLPRGVYFVQVLASGKTFNSKVLNNNN